MPELPKPIVLAFVVCERTLHSPKMGTFTLRNVMWRVLVRDFPARMATLCAYACLTSLRKSVRIQCRLVRTTGDDPEGEELGVTDVVVAEPDSPLVEYAAGLCLEDVTFPSSGQYRLLLQLDGETIAERKLSVERLGTK